MNSTEINCNCKKGFITCPGCNGFQQLNSICAGCLGTGRVVCGKCNGGYNKQSELESKLKVNHYIVIRNLFLRLLASPFVFALIFIKFNYATIERTFSFIMHGGEWINYDKDKPTIKDIFDQLKKQRND